MPKPYVIAGVAFWLAFAGTAMAEGFLLEETTLTKEELKLFQTIAKTDPSFRYSKDVRRYYRIHPESKVKIPVLVELVFSKTNGLYFEEFIGYGVTVDPDTSIVTYQYDSGTANRGNGSILVTPHAVVKTERSCGVTTCITQIFRNGKKIFEEEG